MDGHKLNVTVWRGKDCNRVSRQDFRICVFFYTSECLLYLPVAVVWTMEPAVMLILVIHVWTILTGLSCNRRYIFWTSVVDWGEKPTTFRRKFVCVLREGLLCHYPPVVGTPTERAGVYRCSVVDTFWVFRAQQSTLSLSPFHLMTETNVYDCLTLHDGKCPKCQSCELWYCFYAIPNHLFSFPSCALCIW